jgi:menaquinone-specific isochorismate synthase
MVRVDTVRTMEGHERRLASASVSVQRPSPMALLQRGDGCARGFWAREGRWFAHIGRAGEILRSSYQEDPNRFESVWAEARDLLSCTWRDPSSEVQPPSPRLFGGFSFQDRHVPGDFWEEFPVARFILPQLELMGVDGTGVLTLRKLLDPGEDPLICGRELEALLPDFLRSRQDASEGEGVRDIWVPATRAETEPAEWHAAVERTLARIEAADVSKVVLARALAVSAEEGLSPTSVAMALWRGNPGSHVFFLEPSPGKAVLGAAPETVATVQGGRFRATAVAGSVSRGSTSAESDALARHLLRSEKDRWEHQVAVQDMVDRLTPLCEEVRAGSEPTVLSLPTIQHLETVIEATLRPNQTVLSALEALHPTAAVCGIPRTPAMQVIQDEEPFQRGWYAGPMGWFDGGGNGVFAPALRFAVFRDPDWRLFAGAGIVSGSDPRLEWEETSIKFQPILRALSEAGGIPAMEAGEAGWCDGAGGVTPRRQGS